MAAGNAESSFLYFGAIAMLIVIITLCFCIAAIVQYYFPLSCPLIYHPRTLDDYIHVKTGHHPPTQHPPKPDETSFRGMATSVESDESYELKDMGENNASPTISLGQPRIWIRAV
ncbi:hypothetical protein SI65_08141 [Aspergillus cristatus]|uniref:Uncharacterized protein n=1 Tax=Aspergillus cristatus TaxID=573508 RepID=A0A1E3B6T1_ASPCR|nr:hypothetical protein SI65_08141 [Aspergillus cristatus]